MLSRAFQNTFGDEGADAMVDWMNQVDSRDSGLRHDISELRTEVRADISNLRADMRADMAELRADMTELRGEMAELRRQMLGGFAVVAAEFVKVRAESATEFTAIRSAINDHRQESKAQFAAMEATAAHRHADFAKWMLGFWLLSLATLVGAIATLARIVAK